MKKVFTVVLAIAALVALTPASHAVTLDTLVAGGTITVGDKLFHNFSYLATGDMPTAANVNVVGVVIAGNNGIEFQGAFLDLPGGGASDALIQYQVTVLDPFKLITDAHLQGNPSVIGGTGLMAVTETFVPDSTNQMDIFDIEPGATVLKDFTAFGTGFTTLKVQKDIFALSGTGVATLSFVDQTFSQAAIPEPASLVLLGLGSLGTLGFGLRRRFSA